LEPRRVAAPPLKRASGAELIIHRVVVMLSVMRSGSELTVSLAVAQHCTIIVSFS
jgi:hypothetical protein